MQRADFPAAAVLLTTQRIAGTVREHEGVGELAGDPEAEAPTAFGGGARAVPTPRAIPTRPAASPTVPRAAERYREAVFELRPAVHDFVMDAFAAG